MKNENSAWNLAMGIGGGVAIGICAVAAVAAAPVEIAATAVAVGVTKWALNNKKKSDEEDLIKDA